ncbi:unnamed protein product [Rotaria sordida]|uniref:Uncharacterized protein n=1 Tax=Rotaria sordida TaxID=392033 RepID=A0A814IG63_9BILA|nr:unnamed protein product [Rotaria sordida]CAF3951799.1 unnamed protein product [Rotaria sordida]CAF3992853.1 unnamed protein product [Rotaria sordida]
MNHFIFDYKKTNYFPILESQFVSIIFFFANLITTTILVERFNGNVIGDGGRLTFGITIDGIDYDGSDVLIGDDECFVDDNSCKIPIVNDKLSKENDSAQ